MNEEQYVVSSSLKDARYCVYKYKIKEGAL